MEYQLSELHWQSVSNSPAPLGSPTGDGNHSDAGGSGEEAIRMQLGVMAMQSGVMVTQCWGHGNALVGVMVLQWSGGVRI